jgi:glycosyltransferase involved in cell wall biosynthesis
MNISFLTSGHEPFDDRIFYHMGRSLSDKNENVEIVSSKCQLTEVKDGIKLNCFAGDNLSKRDKIKQFTCRLSIFEPDIIVCSEPLTILASKYYTKRQNRSVKVIYDITEWYPSKKNLTIFKWPLKWLKFINLLLFNLWMANYADSFIFGEWFKSRPYRFLFPHKSFKFIPYYPDLQYICYCPPNPEPGRLRLSYSGKISLEKGYKNFFMVLGKLSELNKDLKIDVKIIGWYESPLDKAECETFLYPENPNITIRRFEKLIFRNFIEVINDTDIFMDLRADDLENQHCLPIKLFYYAALGRPVIISDLKAIRRETEINKFGFLVKPQNSGSIADIISDYLTDPLLYFEHCRNARSLAENYYNWQKIEGEFINFILL